MLESCCLSYVAPLFFSLFLFDWNLFVYCFCFFYLSYFTSLYLLACQFSTAVHEICHALGFDADSLRYFRDPEQNGAPRSPRDAVTGQLSSSLTFTNFQCPNSKTEASISLPDSNTVVVRVETERGVKVATVVTPKVRAVAREMVGG